MGPCGGTNRAAARGSAGSARRRRGAGAGAHTFVGRIEKRGQNSGHKPGREGAARRGGCRAQGKRVAQVRADAPARGAPPVALPAATRRGEGEREGGGARLDAPSIRRCCAAQFVRRGLEELLWAPRTRVSPGACGNVRRRPAGSARGRVGAAALRWGLGRHPEASARRRRSGLRVQRRMLPSARRRARRPPPRPAGRRPPGSCAPNHPARTVNSARKADRPSNAKGRRSLYSYRSARGQDNTGPRASELRSPPHRTPPSSAPVYWSLLAFTSCEQSTFSACPGLVELDDSRSGAT